MLNGVDIDILNNQFLSKFNLSDDDIEMVLKYSKVVAFNKNETIYTKDNCLGFALVKSGELRAYILNSNFKEMSIFSLKTNSTCVLCSSYVVNEYEIEINLEAKSKTEVIIIPSEIYKNLKHKYEEIEIYTLKMMSKRFADTINLMQQVLFLPLVDRIRNFLLQNAVQGRVKITHLELADRIGSAREAVSRILKEMQNRGELELYRGCIVLKTQKL